MLKTQLHLGQLASSKDCMVSCGGGPRTCSASAFSRAPRSLSGRLRRPDSSDGAFGGMTSEQRTRVLRTIRSLNVDYAISADRRGLLAGEDVSYLNSRVSTRAKDIQLDTRWSKMFV